MNDEAIAYLRDSTKMQEASIPEQRKAIDKYAREHGLRIIQYFEDNGRSGRNAEERPGFMKVIDCAKTHNDFKYILVYDVSRWGRFENPKEATYWEIVCEKVGKKVKYCTEGYINDDTIGSYITKVVKDSEASEYSSKLSKTSFRGHRHYAEKGYHVGGGKKYGYSRLLLDESGNPVKILADHEHKATKQQRVKLAKGASEEVKTVQRIYDMNVNKNCGIGNICKILNTEGIPSPRNRGWSKSTVWTILHDETYIGWVVWNRHVCKNLHEKKNGWVKYKPQTEWIICKNAHEPIISEELFKAVQAKTRQAYKGGSSRLKGGGNGHYTPYLLSGVIKCAKCSSNFQGRVITSRTPKKTYESRYYICGNFTMRDSCEKWSVPKDMVEDFAVQEIKKRLNNPFWIQTIKERLEKKISAIKKDSSKDIAKIGAELGDIQSQIDNLTDAVAKGFDKDIAIEKIKDIKAKRDRLLDMRAQYNKEVSIETDTGEAVDHVLHQLKTFEKEFPKAEIPTKKMWLSKFIHEIRVDPIEKKCYYYIKIIPDFQGGVGENSCVSLVHKQLSPPFVFKALLKFDRGAFFFPKVAIFRLFS